MPLSRRHAAILLAVACVASAGSAFAAPIRGDDLVACRNKGQIHVGKDGWIAIKAPPVTPAEGPREIVDFAAPPFTPKVMYATNGAVIKNSQDGGCNWSVVTNGIDPPRTGAGPAQAPDTAKPDVFTHLVAPMGSVMWAAGYDDVGGVPHPHVYQFVGLDTEEPTESRVENGLPPVGRPIDMVATWQAKAVVYLLVEEPPDPRTGSIEPAHHLYVTNTPDDPQELSAVGNVWKQVPEPPAGFGRIEGVTIAKNGRQAWIWSDTSYATAPDTLADDVKWVSHPSPGGAITAIDVNAVGQALVTAKGDNGGAAAELAGVDGKVLGSAKIPVLPTSMAHGRTMTVRAVSGEKGTWGYDTVARKWVDITPRNAGALSNLTMGQGLVERILLGNTKDAIYRFDTYQGERFVKSSTTIPTGPTPPVPPFTEPYLHITPNVLTVQPGEVKKADVEFGMPPDATPLDVFFVVDTTGSMNAAIKGLQDHIYDIASTLKRTLGDDVCFGVGDFKDASNSPNDIDKVYRTHQTIDCDPNPKLPRISAALKKLEANGGGAQPPEAQTIALDQMVTGSGWTRPLVLPGKQARFRDKAYKVAVLITDVNFNEGVTGDGVYPTTEEVSTTLNVNGVKVVGVQAFTNNDADAAYAALTKLARLTDTVAPEGGVDCDGDGKQSWGDVPAGAPLVCQTPGNDPQIGPAITSLLLGVVDPGTVAMHIADPDHAIRGPIEGATARIMNLKRASVLPLTVPVSCTPAQDGKDLVVTFVPSVRALPVGLSGDLTVRCRSVPPRPPVEPPDPRDPPLFERPPLRGLAAVALVPPANPPAQPISNINLNAGFSQQEEQQFQLAAVTQGATDAEEEAVELAMLGNERPERATPAGAFVAGAMALTAGAALAYRRRLQNAAGPAYLRVRR